MNKLLLYWHTVKNMKPSQVYYRIRKMLGLRSTLGIQPLPMPVYGQLKPAASVLELDFDPVFLRRFPAEEFLEGKMTFLHESEQFDGNGKWAFPDRTPLWNFNLHYFEFLLSLTAKYRQTGDTDYLNRIKAYISGWIQHNPQTSLGAGWSAYTISLRLVNWLSCYMAIREDLDKDTEFLHRMLDSMYDQYVFLANHLERDLLGNHYFENLKTLVICAVFFDDGKLLQTALKELKEQCREQILPDGMHFELSPMYHKIILEDVLRVTVVLKTAGRPDPELENYIQNMLDVAYSLEEGLGRIPLFNDCGNNVAKSLDALCLAAKTHFGILPQYRSCFPDSGYYIFKQGPWKLIVDAGQPGPKYIPGHAHCDAMSFELFKSGKPVLVNCGTYAYQCKERAFFRSTAAHNTVQIKDVEQSVCWSVFRLAKACRVTVMQATCSDLRMEMTDQMGSKIRRKISLNNNELVVSDSTEGKRIQTHIHYPCDMDPKISGINCSKIDKTCVFYAEEYGVLSTCTSLRLSSMDTITYCIDLNSTMTDLKGL